MHCCKISKLELLLVQEKYLRGAPGFCPTGAERPPQESSQEQERSYQVWLKLHNVKYYIFRPLNFINFTITFRNKKCETCMSLDLTLKLPKLFKNIGEFITKTYFLT